MTGIRPLREEDLRVDCGAGDAAPIDCGVRHLQATRKPATAISHKDHCSSRVTSIPGRFRWRAFVRFAAGTDFPNFYSAARMLLDGHGRQLSTLVSNVNISRATLAE